MPRKKYLTEEERLEAKRERYRRWYEKNREAIEEYNRQYREEHLEEILERGRETRMRYREEKPVWYHKIGIISSWKRSGLIHEDYDGLYAEYRSSTHCEECGIPYGKYGDGSGTFKCMDHEHETGKFRNFLCNGCNIRRGHEDKAKLKQLETELPSE